jgi:hypothetical protein
VIKANRGRILVKVIPRYGDLQNKLQLTLVDKKKHYVGTRKGEVISVGRGVYEVAVGDVVYFRGDAGFTLDGDPEFAYQDSDNNFHWLKESDCLAVEDKGPVELKELQEAVS